jgi:hypothetical protein
MADFVEACEFREACEEGDIEKVKSLLDNGVSANIVEYKVTDKMMY